MAEEGSDAPETSPTGEDLERAIGLYPAVAIAVAVSVATAIALGVLYGPGPALLVLAASAMLGAVMLLWSSLRNLTGDAPIDPRFDEAMVRAKVTEAAERKRIVLRALKDLETERDVGKLDDDDYERLAAQYRAQAKAILREMDEEIDPRRAKAERVARAHLQKKGLVAGYRDATPPEDSDEEAHGDRVAPPKKEVARVTCEKCGVSNDDDAEFCKKCGKRLAP